MLKKSCAIVVSTVALAAQTMDRSKPPETPPIPSYKLPPVYETRLPNGLGVLLVEDGRFPLVTARLNMQAGSKFDPRDLPGLAEGVAAVLTEGTQTRTARQISEETDALGGSLGASAGEDSMTISGGALAENLARLMVLISDVARNATFPKEEVDLYKQNRLQSLMADRSQPGFLADEKMAEVVYGSSPYAHIAPTPEAIQKLDSQTLAGFRDKHLAPNNGTLILIGKLPARAEVLKLIAGQFGSWARKPVAAQPKVDLPAPKRQIVLVDRAGSVQADIHVGRLAPTALTPEYFPLTVATTALGGGTNSRMFKNIREKEGFAYDAHSSYDAHRDAADFEAVTQVRNEVIEPAMKAVLAEMEGMAGAPMPAGELSNVKNFISGIFLLGLETETGLANELTSVKARGLPNDYLETYTAKVRAVEAKQVQAAAKKYIAPGQSAVVVVGDASKIGEALRKLGTVTVTKAQ
jgi:zinc protease